jgi:type 1 glutamine amidotransferase
MTTLCRRPWLLGLLATLILAQAPAAVADEKIRVLIIDGQNNHNWKAMTPPMTADLVKSGRFSVEVATTPERKSAREAWNTFHPDFSRFDVVLSNYNGEPWPDAVQKGLERFVAGGGGLVVIHAANNAFEGWTEWNKMIGLGWRRNDFGERLTIDESGKVVRTSRGAGPSAGHGAAHPYKIVIRDPDHPITRGMPREWMHAKDELYHGQRGPAENMEILASAFSAREKGGTGTNEPMAWVIPYGKGRVFTTVLGHVGNDTAAIRDVGFKTLMLRGTEWAATGKVTIPIPANFPTADEVRLDPEVTNP